MMTKKLFFCACIALTLHAVTSSAQTPSIPKAGVEITKAIPASPDAASLGKYGSIPVSPYTGVPNISVPLYTIKSGDLTLPLSLSYHSGGNKIEEMASSVGLGWSLNAGGAITRTIRGKADEEEFGFLDPNRYVPKIDSLLALNNKANADLNYYLNLMVEGTVDGEADMYNYNFGGYSGKFVMDPSGNVSTIPLTRIKFTFQVNTIGRFIESFTAVTPDGVTYIFGGDAIEKTNTRITCAVADGPSNKKDNATSWFVKQIISPTNHEINFTYTTETYSVVQTRSQTKYVLAYTEVVSPDVVFPTDEDCAVTNVIHGVKLSTISFDHGGVNITTAARQDISNAKLISAITVSNNAVLKNYQLYYTNGSAQRLRLDSLIEQPSTSSQKQKYSFAYYGDSWTSGSNYQQDWWGFNNGQSSNNTLVPWQNIVIENLGGSLNVKLAGAERSTNEQYMLGGTLFQINYPTGGHTTFTYEANHVSNIDLDGTSSSYPSTSHSKQLTNDPGSAYYDGGANNFLIDTMHVVSLSGKSVRFGIHGQGFATSQDPNSGDGNFMLATLSRLDSVSVVCNIPNTDSIIYLRPGIYQIKVTDNKNQRYSPTKTDGLKYELYVGWETVHPGLYNNYIVGGLRVKQVADYDGISSTKTNVKTYQYTLPGSSYSSGWLEYQPKYNYRLGMDLYNSVALAASRLYFNVRTAVSNYPLATTQGSVVGYSHVTELNGVNGENGKTDYFFTNAQTYPDLHFSEIFPFAPPSNRDWKRGSLVKQIDYRNSGSNTFAKLSEKITTYNAFAKGAKTNIKAGLNPTPGTFYNQSVPYYNADIMKVVIYTDSTDFTYPASTITKTYDGNDTTHYAQTVAEYTYDTGSYQLSQLVSTNSSNESIIQRVTYPNNYTVPSNATNSALKGILNLQNKNILSTPIEIITQKQTTGGGNLRTIGSVLTTYKPTQPLRDTVFELRSAIPLTSFTTSTVGSGSLTKDSHYQPVVAFNKYDYRGNIVQENKIGDTPRSYIWGHPAALYNFTYPIAEVLNADSVSIAYTNFDSYTISGSSYGNWNYSISGNTTDATAPMGAVCYSLSGNTISKSSLSSSATYRVSFWAKTGASVTITGGTVTATITGETINGWTYREYKVTGTTSVSITGSGYIDELRLYPFDAQMSTYTYIPLIGMSSACDAKNQFSYYQYDENGRLIIVKDQYGNILKQNGYHYKQ